MMIFFSDSFILWGLFLTTLIPLTYYIIKYFQRELKKINHQLSFFQVPGTLKKLKPSSSLYIRQAILKNKVDNTFIFNFSYLHAHKQVIISHNITTDGIDIMLVIDTSESMKALDLDTHKSLKHRRNRSRSC